MRKEEIDRLIKELPDKPFEVRLVNGQSFRFTSPEQLIVSRSAIITLDKNQDMEIINLTMIATIQVRNGRHSTKK